jgi:hypothetical protein
MTSPIAARPSVRTTSPHAPHEAPKSAPCKAFSLAPPEATGTSGVPAAPPRPAGPLSPAAAPAPSATPGAEAAKRLVTRMLDDEAAVDRGLHAAMSGRQMSAPQLLVLQAQVIQYSQELEVASRVVDKATGAVKQVLQTQV